MTVLMPGADRGSQNSGLQPAKPTNLPGKGDDVARQKLFDSVPRLGDGDNARDKVCVIRFPLAGQQSCWGSPGDTLEKVRARRPGDRGGWGRFQHNDNAANRTAKEHYTNRSAMSRGGIACNCCSGAVVEPPIVFG